MRKRQKKGGCSRFARLIGIELGHEHAAALHKVIVVDVVKHEFALLATGDQLELLEDAEVVRNGWLGHVESIHDVTDALFPVQQHHQDLLASIVGQGFAKLDTIDHHVSPSVE
jgi:hypothetical protein